MVSTTAVATTTSGTRRRSTSPPLIHEPDDDRQAGKKKANNNNNDGGQKQQRGRDNLPQLGTGYQQRPSQPQDEVFDEGDEEYSDADGWPPRQGAEKQTKDASRSRASGERLFVYLCATYKQIE